MTEHEQTRFINANGHVVQVDAGIIDILNGLRDHGVVTQFSCQGSEKHSAYVLASRKSFLPFIKKVKRLYKKGLLSKDASYVVSQFKNHHRGVEARLWFSKTDSELHLRFHRGPKFVPGYEFKVTWSLQYGWRIVARCRPEDIPKVQTLIDEVS